MKFQLSTALAVLASISFASALARHAPKDDSIRHSQMEKNVVEEIHPSNLDYGINGGAYAQKGRRPFLRTQTEKHTHTLTVPEYIPTTHSTTVTAVHTHTVSTRRKHHKTKYVTETICTTCTVKEKKTKTHTSTTTTTQSASTSTTTTTSTTSLTTTSTTTTTTSTTVTTSTSSTTTPIPTGINLLINGGFENGGLYPWTVLETDSGAAVGVVTGSSSNDPAHTGDNQFQANFFPVPGRAGEAVVTGTILLRQVLNLVPNQEYLLSAWTRLLEPDCFVNYLVDLVLEMKSVAPPSGQENNWFQTNTTFLANGGSTSLDIFMTCQNIQQESTFYLDDVSVAAV